MDGSTLAGLEARRAALDAEIRRVKQDERQAWNDGIDQCESALNDWLGEHAIEVTTRDRKNETIWDVGHGALTVTFGEAGTEWAPGLRLLSGGTLTLEWSEVPTPARFLAIVAALLNADR